MRVPNDLPDDNSGASSPPLDMEAEADLARCGALKHFWYVACLSTELTKAQPLARTIFGTHVVLFRDHHGQAVALYDRCLHRHARLSAGRVCNGRLGCPYHGWVYDGTGRCVEIPSLGPTQHGQGLSTEAHACAGLKRTPSEVGQVKRFATLEQDGLVYVFMGDAPGRALCPAFRIPYWDAPDWCIYYMVTHFPNGVTHLVENFMDVPHTVFVHHGWFRKRTQQHVPAVVTRCAGSVCVTYKQDRDVLTGLGRLLNPWGEAMAHTDRFSIPNITRVDYTFGSRSGFVITSQCTPIAALESLVYTAISYRLPVDLPIHLLTRLLRPLIKWYTTQVIRQDVDIMRVQRDGLLNRPGDATFVSTEADLPHTDIETYRAWLLAGAVGDGPPDVEREIVMWI